MKKYIYKNKNYKDNPQLYITIHSSKIFSKKKK